MLPAIGISWRSCVDGKQSSAGFTLLETLIYIGLFSIVIGGGVISAFYIIDSGQNDKSGVNLQAEGNFILRKFEWAMTGATSISVVSPTKLSIVKDTTTGFLPSQNPLVFSLDGTNVQLARGTGIAVNMNSANVAVSAVNGALFYATGGAPAGIVMNFTISSEDPQKNQTFSVTKYLRQ